MDTGLKVDFQQAWRTRLRGRAVTNRLLAGRFATDASVSNRARIAGAAIAAVLFAAAPFFASLAHGQARHEARENERARFQTPHWVFDDRYHHNRYYPSFGYSLSVLPAGSISVAFRSGRFFFNAGVWFQPAASGYVVVRPPVGIVVPVLPPGYTTVWSSGAPYYYANDVYYTEAPGGYVVSAPPMDASAASAPVPPAPPPAPQAIPAPGASAPVASAAWYYCDSARAYYPYVSECKEGWRAVPATPPQAPR